MYHKISIDWETICNTQELEILKYYTNLSRKSILTTTSEKFKFYVEMFQFVVMILIIFTVANMTLLVIFYISPLMPKILDHFFPLQDPRPYNFLINLEFLLYGEPYVFIMNYVYNTIGSTIGLMYLAYCYNTLLLFTNHIYANFSIIA